MHVFLVFQDFTPFSKDLGKYFFWHCEYYFFI